MKINQHESIIGKSCILVPYCSKHVQKYHGWMENEELLIATSSEPLTLVEEYEMQKKWQDSDKLTFIILDKQTFEAAGDDEIGSMAGDVNAFICQQNEDEEPT
uniref:Uncharacterized protein n=1 Tax=Meloidogyne javanica TaxID=6303 RepID=A0A915LL80_MELJA